MQPITYSLIFNVIGVLLAAALSYQFNVPWLFLVVLMIQSHTLERFVERVRQDEEDDDDAQPMGFTADIR